ncbi:hypothetical protein M2308_002692 [Rhizobium leguminosarum]|nr:hypothetical protein [Rhizobium leguminosarum]
MTQSSIWNIVQALSAFKSQRRRDANHEYAIRQLKRFPSHLLADCQRKMELNTSAAEADDRRWNGGHMPPNSLKAMTHIVNATSVSSIRQDEGFEKIGRNHVAPYPSEKKNRKEPVTAPAANEVCCPG